MSLKLHHQGLIPPRSSTAFLSQTIMRSFPGNRITNLDHLLFGRGHSRKRSRTKLVMLADGNLSLNCKLVDFRKYGFASCRTKKKHLFPFLTSDDGAIVNGIPQASSSSDVEGMRIKLDQSLQTIDYSDGLVQSLHDAARVFELAIKDHSSSLKMSWFSTAWLGVDKNAWVKALSYQASVHALLQAASEISSRGDGRDNDINVFVHRSLLRLSGPLEGVIRENLLSKQPEISEWFWSEQVPAVVTGFVNYFESNPRFTAATAMSAKGVPLSSRNEYDISLLMLALSCISAITKLGPTKVSCPQFFSMVPDISGRLMEMLVNFVSIRQAYRYVKDIGLRREFFVRFGPQAAACRVKFDHEMEEVVFWVNLIQKQLQRAIHRERIWSRLVTCESIEVLEKDLAIFGFFIALGRCTQSFLFAQGFDVVDEPLEGFVRYLIGGSVLYYPQLASISSYQLYVEVVCEELEWLPFYPGITSNSKRLHGHKSKREGPPNPEAIREVLDVCSHWIQSFIKYSSWLESPSNVKAARFISRGHNKLMGCMEELGIRKNEITKGSGDQSFGSARSEVNSLTNKGLDSSFDKALGSVEEALIRLEELLQELHVSSSSSGKEQLKAACSDLEKIRRLKKEAEFLEASFRAKAAFLQQADDVSDTGAYVTEKKQQSKGANNKSATVESQRSRGLWNFLARQPSRDSDSGSLTANRNQTNYECIAEKQYHNNYKDLGWALTEEELTEDDEPFEKSSGRIEAAELQTNEMKRFELLRNELMEIEERVQRSSDRSEIREEDIQVRDDTNYTNTSVQLVPNQKKENIIEKSIDKLKETSTDVWQGTQLLAIDVAAASGLLRRVLVGDELTEKEKQALQRTVTDVASVVPIGILMLLPVTAVGHAAMLAAIQRYVPSLIPSTYGPERLDLLRQLEKLKLETIEANPSENAEELQS